MRRRKERRGKNGGEDVNPMNYVSNLSDVMLVLAIGIMIALIAGWNVQGWNTAEAEETTSPEENRIELSSEDVEEIDEEKDSEEMQKLGAVYYDPDTGNYYIIQD